MLITCGEQKIEIRIWGKVEARKALLITRDEGIKRRIASVWHQAPNVFETLSGEELSPEDFEGAFMAVFDRDKVGLVIDLSPDEPGIGVGVCEEYDEDPEED